MENMGSILSSPLPIPSSLPVSYLAQSVSTNKGPISRKLPGMSREITISGIGSHLLTKPPNFGGGPFRSPSYCDLFPLNYLKGLRLPIRRHE